MIRFYALAAVLAGGLWLAWQAHRNDVRADAAEDALASAVAQLAQVEKARAVHEEHIAIMARQQAAYEALVSEFETMEGANAPLSPYLRAVDQRLQ